ncbi:MAG: S8 family peptidase [Theionarchaea archaeon]|nr:S8 family peptidase [Theionarchaea archaeon]MBU7021781.1 S8 family peptidase [Theionarchaea archaeon]
MPEKRRKQKSLFESERRDHIPLGDLSAKTEKKPKRRFFPKMIDEKDIPRHSEILSAKFEKSVDTSRSRRIIFQTHNVYFKVTLMNEVYYQEDDLEKMGVDLLVVTDNKKAVVRLEDKETAELSNKIRYYEEQEFKTLLRKLSSIEPIEVSEKIKIELEDEIKEGTEEDRRIFVEIRLFPNLDQEEYAGALRSIKEYVVNKGEEFVSEAIEEKRAKARVKIHLSSIRELAEGVEPISTIDTVPLYHVGLLRSKKIDRDLEEFSPQIKENSPAVCVIDSGVVEDHPLLQGVVEEVADFTEESGDGFDNVGHGTFVTGLVSYGDSLHYGIQHPDIRVIAAKVINKYSDHIDLERILPEVVKRFCRETKIFNMSISKGSCCRPLDTELASVIDELERKYNVVFCIPTGNIPRREIQKFIDNGRPYPSYLGEAGSLLLQPGEACNAITVGSLAREESPASLAPKNAPSPFTRRGPTPEGRIKPDFVEFDGNVSCIERPNGVLVYEDENISTISLNSSFEDGYLTTDNGTSFAVPLISRYAAKIIQKFPRASPNLVKALLINSIAFEYLSRSDKQILGHGKPILENALYSTPYRVTYYFESHVNIKDKKVIKFRVPENIREIRGRKRIFITLVYDPPVDSSKEYYVLTGLDWKLHKGGTNGFQAPSLRNWVYDTRANKWDNAKIGIYEWKRTGWGQDWDIHIIPRFPRASEYKEYDQHFALVVTLEDISRSLDVHTAVMNELGITVRDIERIRVR